MGSAGFATSFFTISPTRSLVASSIPFWGQQNEHGKRGWMMRKYLVRRLARRCFKECDEAAGQVTAMQASAGAESTAAHLLSVTNCCSASPEGIDGSLARSHLFCEGGDSTARTHRPRRRGGFTMSSTTGTGLPDESKTFWSMSCFHFVTCNMQILALPNAAQKEDTRRNMTRRQTIDCKRTLSKVRGRVQSNTTNAPTASR